MSHCGFCARKHGFCFDVLDKSMTPKGEASLWVGATCDATLQDSQHCVLTLSAAAAGMHKAGRNLHRLQVSVQP